MSPEILIVDDDTDQAEQVRELLEGHGYPVSVAVNGREALDHLIARPEPKVVLLDLKMPVMDGWELLSLMRSYTRLSRIPVVLVTAEPPRAQTRPAFDAVLRKPIAEEQLIDAVARVAAGGRAAVGG